MRKYLVLLTIVFISFFQSQCFPRSKTNNENIICPPQSINIDNKNHVKKLIAIMFKQDQEIRKKFMQNTNSEDISKAMSKLDQCHTSLMKKILIKYGWVDIASFGKKTSDEAFLLIQHADHDPFFQAGSLLIMSHFAQKNRSYRKHYPLLYDRVMLKFTNLGFKQKYATQIEILDNCQLKIRPYEGTLEEVAIRRKEYGLPPLADYLEVIKSYCRTSPTDP